MLRGLQGKECSLKKKRKKNLKLSLYEIEDEANNIYFFAHFNAIGCSWLKLSLQIEIAERDSIFFLNNSLFLTMKKNIKYENKNMNKSKNLYEKIFFFLNNKKEIKIKKWSLRN